MTFLCAGAAMTIASSIGEDVFPVVSDHFKLDIVHVGHIYWWENHAA